MNTPSLDWFCENGHHFLSIPHHLSFGIDWPHECNFCGSTNIYISVARWMEAERGFEAVPSKPIRTDTKYVEVNLNEYNLYVKDKDGDYVPLVVSDYWPNVILYKKTTCEVYDVSRLFRRNCRKDKSNETL